MALTEDVTVFSCGSAKAVHAVLLCKMETVSRGLMPTIIQIFANKIESEIRIPRKFVVVNCIKQTNLGTM